MVVSATSEKRRPARGWVADSVATSASRDGRLESRDPGPAGGSESRELLADAPASWSREASRSALGTPVGRPEIRSVIVASSRGALAVPGGEKQVDSMQSRWM